MRPDTAVREVVEATFQACGHETAMALVVELAELAKRYGLGVGVGTSSALPKLTYQPPPPPPPQVPNPRETGWST